MTSVDIFSTQSLAWWSGTDLNFDSFTVENKENLRKLAPDTKTFFEKYVRQNDVVGLSRDVEAALDTTEEYALDLARRTIEYFTQTWAPKNISQAPDTTNKSTISDSPSHPLSQSAPLFEDFVNRTFSFHESRTNQAVNAVLHTMQAIQIQLELQNSSIEDLSQTIATIRSDLSKSISSQSPVPHPSTPPQTTPLVNENKPVQTHLPPPPPLPSFPIVNITPSFVFPKGDSFRRIGQNTVMVNKQNPQKVFVDYIIIEKIVVLEWEVFLRNRGHISIGLVDWTKEDPKTVNSIVFNHNGTAYVKGKNIPLAPFGDSKRVIVEVDCTRRTASFAVGNNNALLVVSNIPTITKAFVTFSDQGQSGVVRRFEQRELPSLDITSFTKACQMI
ncbi:hypothetical protein BLNAU_16598 [Blattamonas nauphoetae]|uniref:Uncharacterized protein n=1 Tax=Blattamonas nauphoetae TaxID=2049346 RepID=A0ABQ9X8A2_9EUKA|nr:hypothetical protein BLNAU_16598 [Blattamonas nauphoetae]